MPAVIVNDAVEGDPLPILNRVAPPFMLAKQAGAALNVAEKLTVAIVPVVAVPPTMVSVPLVLLQENPEAHTTEVTPLPTANVAVPVGIDNAFASPVHVTAFDPLVTQSPLSSDTVSGLPLRSIP